VALAADRSFGEDRRREEDLQLQVAQEVDRRDLQVHPDHQDLPQARPVPVA
jgi:hypothetical protein